MIQLFDVEDFDTPNLCYKLNLLTIDEQEEIKNGLQWMKHNTPHAVLIGGCAVVHYLPVESDRILTPDIDFIVEDLDRIQQKLDYDQLSYFELSDQLGVLVRDYNCDFLNADSGNVILNKMVLQTATTHKINGTMMKVITPELLVIMKMEVSRQKDIHDAYELLQSGSLDKERYLYYLTSLKNHLKEFDTHMVNALFL